MASETGQHTESRLIEIGHAYIRFLNLAGIANDRTFEKEVPQLFAKKCTKVVNSKPKFDKGSEVGDYLWKAQEIYGKWQINPNYDLFPSLSTCSITINFTAETSQIHMLVIAILKINKEGLITKIYEVDTTLNRVLPTHQHSHIVSVKQRGKP